MFCNIWFNSRIADTLQEINLIALDHTLQTGRAAEDLLTILACKKVWKGVFLAVFGSFVHFGAPSNVV